MNNKQLILVLVLALIFVLVCIIFVNRLNYRLTRIERNIEMESVVRGYVINKITEGEVFFDKVYRQRDTVRFYKDDVLLDKIVFQKESKWVRPTRFDD
jgi:hypothetical protein